jgi:ketosteroid isomerase-like protein
VQRQRTGGERIVTDREKIKSLIEQAYEARRTENIDLLMAAVHPDCKFEIVGAKPQAQAAGIAQGHAQLRQKLTELIGSFQFVRRDLLNTIIEDDRAAVHSRVVLCFVPNGQTETTEIVDLWKFEGGKIIELIEFVDTALVNEMMR